MRLEHDRWFFTGYENQTQFGEFSDFVGFNNLFNAAFDNAFNSEYDSIYNPEFVNHWNETIAHNYLHSETGKYVLRFNELAEYTAESNQEQEEFMAKYFSSEYADAGAFGDFINSEMQDDSSPWYFDQAAALAQGEAAAHNATKEALISQYGVSTFEEVWQAIYDSVYATQYDTIYETEIAKYEGLRTVICDWARAELLNMPLADLYDLITAL